MTILNQIYEVDVQGFSHGFRPGRSPQQALHPLYVGIQRKRVNWVLDADTQGFFDHVSHDWALKFVEHHVADRRMLRLIQKWLKAGVSEDGQWSSARGCGFSPARQRVSTLRLRFMGRSLAQESRERRFQCRPLRR